MIKRQWMSMCRYREVFNENPYDIGRKLVFVEKGNCNWCGKKLSGRRTVYCSDECSRIYNNVTLWNRGVARLPYAILCRDNFTCTECGEIKIYINEHDIKIPIGIDLEVHHIVPVHKGGSDHQSNLRTVCCNCHKEIHKQLNEHHND